jgi:hypothetical protein
LAFVVDFGDFVGSGTTQVLLLLLPFLCCIWSVVFLVDETRHHATTQTGMNTHTHKTKREQQSERERRSYLVSRNIGQRRDRNVHRSTDSVHMHAAVSSKSNSANHQGTTRCTYTVNPFLFCPVYITGKERTTE